MSRLPPTSETKLQLIYKRSVRNSTDPFKKAVHCLLARCEVHEDHREVCSKTEDYMWLKVGGKVWTGGMNMWSEHTSEHETVDFYLFEDTCN